MELRHRSLPRIFTGGTNATGEHEVELLWFRYLIVGVGIRNFVLSAKFTEFRTGIIV